MTNVDTLPPVPKKKMVMRSLRVPEGLWEDARKKADEQDLNISDVIRALLEQHVNGDKQ